MSEQVNKYHNLNFFKDLDYALKNGKSFIIKTSPTSSYNVKTIHVDTSSPYVIVTNITGDKMIHFHEIQSYEIK